MHQNLCQLCILLLPPLQLMWEITRGTLKLYQLNIYSSSHTHFHSKDKTRHFGSFLIASLLHGLGNPCVLSLRVSSNNFYLSKPVSNHPIHQIQSGKPFVYPLKIYSSLSLKPCAINTTDALAQLGGHYSSLPDAPSHRSSDPPLLENQQATNGAPTRGADLLAH